MIIPYQEIEVRRLICSSCPTPCKNIPNVESRCSECPLPIRRWGQYGGCGNKPEENVLIPSRGLGDLVYFVANPIARVIDAVAGTKVASCGSCAKRRAALNKIVPEI
jgi:hypothetical protein